MIKISELTANDRGRKVIYHRPYCKQEIGKLTSWNKQYIYVQFKGPNGEACEPEDVTFYGEYKHVP